MKQLLLIVVSFISLSLSAQILISRDKLWSTMAGPISGCKEFYCSSYFSKLGNDTLIVGKKYSKVLRSDDQEMKKWTFDGAIREEQQKVYFLPLKSDNEYLLYDFDCKAGSTIPLNFRPGSSYKVDSINQKIVEGTSRKFFYLTYSHNQCQSREVWIEGIGSTMGVLNSGGKGHCITGGQEELLCFTENSIYKYRAPGISRCFLSPDIINTIKLPNTIPDVEIFPNPAFGKLYVRGYQPGQKYGFEIITISSTTILSGIIDGDRECTINIQSLKKGLYFFILYTDKNHLTRKFIKQ